MKDALYLEISRKNENLEISLSQGEQTVVHYEECRVPGSELQNRSGELLHLLNSVSRHGKIPPMQILPTTIARAHRRGDDRFCGKGR